MALITELDDRTLVERHRAGDEDAFRRIVERHHRSLYANALRRLSDPVLAEDAVQEAFLRAFRNLDRFDGAYHLDAWLHRIVTNTCHDIGRRKGRDTRLFDRACTAVEIEAPAADEALDATPRDQITDALDQLPESYREVLLLRFVDEMSYEDVALKAGISEENARARVSRGRTMLKRMLSSTSALLVWAIPPLRRTQGQLTGSEADVANQAAGQVQAVTGLTSIASTAAPAVQSAPGFGHLSSLAAQAGPTIAQALPTATTTGSTLGKAAVAVGIAASMAIPTGIAVDRSRDKPAPPAAAPLVDEADAEALPPTTVVSPTVTSSVPQSPVSALGSGEAEVLSVTNTTLAPTSTTVPQQQSSTTTTTVPAPAPVTDGPTGPDPSDGTDGEAEQPPAAPVVGPSGDLTASALQVLDAGPRLELSGPFSMVIGEAQLAGRVEGKVLFAKADAKDPRAPREVDGYLNLRLDDGRTYQIELGGSAIVDEQSSRTVYDLAGVVFRLGNAAELGLADHGQLAGRLERQGNRGTLSLTLPGAEAAQSSDS